MANEISLQGSVVLVSAGKETAWGNARVELKDDTYGWLGSALTDYEGNFTIVLDEATGDQISSSQMTPALVVYDGEIQVYKQAVASLAPIAVAINAGTYASAVKDLTKSAENRDAYFVLYGTLRSASGVPVVNNRIDVYETGFKEEALIVTVYTDLQGYYEAKLSAAQLGQVKNTGAKIATVKAAGTSGSLVESGVIVLNEGRIEVNLQVSDDEVVLPSAFEQMHYVVNAVAGSVDWASLIGSEGDVELLARVTGKAPTETSILAKAHAFGSEWGTAPEYLYALLQAGVGTEKEDLLRLRPLAATSAMQHAIARGLIAADKQEGIAAAVEVLKAQQLAATKAATLVAEEVELGTALDTLLQNSALTDDLLARFRDFEGTDLHTLWDDFATAHGANVALNTQQKLQLLAVSGFQPEIAAYLGNMVPTGLPLLAKQTVEEWEQVIRSVSTSAQKTCVPKAIADQVEGDPVPAYAQRLTEITQALYPFATIAGKLEGAQGSTLIPDSNARSQVTLFLNNNPEFDLRRSSIHDINATDLDLTGITDVDALRSELAPFQRLSRITGGKPDAMAAMKIAGITSAQAISSMPSSQLVAAFGAVFGSSQDALNAYTTAVQISAITAETVTSIQTNEGGSLATSPAWSASQLGPSAAPELQTLFGSLDQCGCDYCMSVYSPSAYYVDILNFLKLQSDDQTYSAYDELLRRRPDLVNIDLTCKNTNTALPYIDLVNEVLESAILQKNGVAVPASYQTQGAAKELAAYPEHKERIVVSGGPDYYQDNTAYQQVYDSFLRQSVYPQNLPFNLAVEETRVYLKHLGFDRFEMMNLYSSDPLSLDIGETGVAEWFGMTGDDYGIIASATSSNTYEFYGLSGTNVTDLLDPADTSATISGLWTDVLTGRVDVLLHQLDISYKELLQLLTTRTLNAEVNGQKPVEIVAHPDASPDTCDLSELKLQFNQPAYDAATFLQHLHRYIRLYRRTGYAIYELDKMLYIAASPSSGWGNIHIDDLYRIAWMADKLSISTDEAVAWNALDTYQYINYNSEHQDLLPSVYDNLFKNKSLLNPPDAAFSDPANLPATYDGHLAAIAAAFRISESDVLRILQSLQLSSSSAVTLPILGKMYGFSALSRSFGLDIEMLMELLEAFGNSMNDTLYMNFRSLSLFALFLETDNNSGFSIKEVLYLLPNKDARNEFTPSSDVIASFFEGLRAALRQLLPDDSGTLTTDISNKIDNLIRDKFVAQFGMLSDMITWWLEEVLSMTDANANPPGRQSVLSALADPVWIRSTVGLSEPAIAQAPPIPGLSFELIELHTVYKQCAKLQLYATRLLLDKDQMEKMGTLTGMGDFTQGDHYEMLIQNDPFQPFFYCYKLALYLQWIRGRDMIGLESAEFVALIDAVSTNSTAAFIDVLEQSKGWGGYVGEFIGDPASSTIDIYSVGLNQLNDFFVLEDTGTFMFQRMILAIQASQQVGLSATNIFYTLADLPGLQDSARIRNAAKAKHTTDEWLSIAKPLQDVLRDKQRTALVGYLLAHPVTSGNNKQLWRNENELYAYYLIDVEMSPCMKTSRIKQAIGTVQQFMDRVIMNLEHQNYDPTRMVTLGTDAISQWKSWRKWYGIWEANRKIFLYPENWIEPELRDDKTPIFQALETQLQQDDVTAEKVEDAYYQYLESLDEVARMEPVTAYHQYEEDEGIDIVHVISRTYAAPNRYYYRRLENDEWSPWEKIEIDIQSEHVTALVWNRRLHLFWLTYSEKEKDWDPGISVSPADILITDEWWVYRVQGRLAKGDVYNDEGDLVDDLSHYWNIMLNWSEYKDGKWLAPKVSKDVMELLPGKVKLTERNKESYSAYGSSDNATLYNTLSKNQELTVTEVFRNRLYLLPLLDANDVLTLSVMFSAGIDEYYMGLHAFVFNDSSTDPYVLRNSDMGTQFLAPVNTLASNMHFQQTPLADIAGNSTDTLKTDGYDWVPAKGYYVYVHNYIYPGVWMPVHNSDAVILNASPNKPYTVTARANMDDGKGELERKPMENHFFYADLVNTFFVRKRAEGINTRKYSGSFTDLKNISLGSVTEGYNSYYGSSTVFQGAIPPDFTPQGWSGNTPATVEPIPTFYTDNYYFQTFYHPHIHQFIKRLNKDGIDGLLQLEMQVPQDTLNFRDTYQPSSLVYKGDLDAAGYPTGYPKNHVDFDFKGTYAQYNWELFFHIPMIVAQRLSDNQQFEDAQKWFHYVFNPTSNVDDTGQFSGESRRFWKFRPFYDEAGKTIVTINDLVEHINQYAAQVQAWEEHPFEPHRIARMRLLAYMKNVLMKYIDNLIAWGDQLFRQDTIESINEATQLYILAANILGPRPQEIAQRAESEYYSFAELISTGPLDDFSNTMVDIETFLGPNAAPANTTNTPNTTPPATAQPPLQMEYFCLPQNDVLLTYWDTVADRLFKIRNCRNIDGVVQELPLYEPPIDPALLVRATAMGIDISTVLDDAADAGLPHYRFAYMLQKANELTADVRELGSELFSALEKKDAEHLALLRSGQELQLLKKVRDVRQAQVSDAEQALDALNKTRENTENRYNYYSSRPYLNSGETQHLQSLQDGLVLQAVQAALEGTAGVLSAIPTAHMQAPGSGISVGGLQFANVMRAASVAMGITAGINNTQGTMAVTKGGYDRRRDDWSFQADTAKKELEQLDAQILGAQIRLDIAQKELDNHDLQIQNATDTDSFIRSKFSNEDLYSWMVSQIAATYFQSYQLAYDVARKAQKCLQVELPLINVPTEGFVKFGYWDSLKKGLLAAESLQIDLRRMEAAYMDENTRERELTKHVSLALTNPQAVLDLREGGLASFTLSRYLFDLDFPGHYLRRIKSVSISIPCVAGPYTTIPATLTLGANQLRNASGVLIPSTARFLSTATSTAQNDSGMFELNFRDERYLPFEGAGVEESAWTLEMMMEKTLRQFDYNTISDIILHIRYTAREEGAAANLKTDAITSLKNMFGAGTGNTGTLVLPRYFSLKYEYANEWFSYSNAFGTKPNTPLTVTFDENAFPFFCEGKTININRLYFQLRTKAVQSGNYSLDVTTQTNGIETTVNVPLSNSNGVFSGATSSFNWVINGNTRLLKLSMKKDSVRVSMDELLDDLYLVADYVCGKRTGSTAPDDIPVSYPLPAGQRLAWWKADTGIALTEGRVSGWADQSGNGVNLSPLNDPGPIPDTTSVNGVAPLVFNGAEGLYTGAFDDTDNLTAVVLINITQSTPNTGILGRNASQASYAGWNLWVLSGFFCFLSSNPDGVSYNVDYSLSIALNSWELYIVRRDATTGYCTIWKDGAQVASVHCGNEFRQSSAPISIGSLGPSGHHGYFKLLEAVVYDRALSDTEVHQCTSYLNDKYDLNF